MQSKTDETWARSRPAGLAPRVSMKCEAGEGGGGGGGISTPPQAPQAPSAQRSPAQRTTRAGEERILRAPLPVHSRAHAHASQGAPLQGAARCSWVPRGAGSPLASASGPRRECCAFAAFLLAPAVPCKQAAVSGLVGACPSYPRRRAPRASRRARPAPRAPRMPCARRRPCRGRCRCGGPTGAHQRVRLLSVSLPAYVQTSARRCLIAKMCFFFFFFFFLLRESRAFACRGHSACRASCCGHERACACAFEHRGLVRRGVHAPHPPAPRRTGTKEPAPRTAHRHLRSRRRIAARLVYHGASGRGEGEGGTAGG